MASRGLAGGGRAAAAPLTPTGAAPQVLAPLFTWEPALGRYAGRRGASARREPLIPEVLLNRIDPSTRCVVSIRRLAALSSRLIRRRCQQCPKRSPLRRDEQDDGYQQSEHGLPPRSSGYLAARSLVSPSLRSCRLVTRACARAVHLSRAIVCC